MKSMLRDGALADIGSRRSASVLIAVALLSGCRSSTSERDPIEPTTLVSGSSGEVSPLKEMQLVGDDRVKPGGTFEVTFSGSMSDARGGSFELRNSSGVGVALLRSDGNPEVPIGYETDPSRFEALADKLSGPGPATLLLPPTISAGEYTVCPFTSLDTSSSCIVIQIG